MPDSVSGARARRRAQMAFLAVVTLALIATFKLATLLHPDALSNQELSLTHTSTAPVHTKGAAPVAPHVGPASPKSQAQNPPTPQGVHVRPDVMRALLKHRVSPMYPEVRVRGHVILAALINKKGEIENLRLLSGHPMLAPSAIDAVKQWRYRPYLVNNEPVEVETTIDVNFSAGR